jgi:CelD/BcsL family acetyltransferase involved in cellulose biosynthesis
MADARLTARVVDPRALDPQLLALWDSLNAGTPGLNSPFLSAHYARAVQAAGMRVRVCVLYRDGQPCGFLPYQFGSLAAALTRTAMPVGGVMTDYVGLVAAPDLHLSPAQLLALARLNSFGFSHLDQSQQAYGLTGEQPRIGLRLRVDPTDSLGAVLGPQHRYLKDSERCERQVVRDLGPIEFVFDQRDRQGELIEQLISHKRAQYQRTGVPDSLQAPWTRRLLHLLAACRHASCHGQLSTLYAGGTWLATHFGMTSHGLLHHWMPVYNPEFAKYAPGRLLMHQMIAACPAAHLHTIDHGEGDSPNKRQVSNEEHFYLRGQWHNKSMMSYVSRGYQSIKWRLEG